MCDPASLLAEDVLQGYAGKVRLVSENFGDSPLAKRFGITRYPAVFIDDILVATPDDFGFFGKGDQNKVGRYTPWRDARNHDRFRDDLTRMLDLVLAGHADAVARAAVPKTDAQEIAELPKMRVKDLAGKDLDLAAMNGQVVVVEFWATWCPPCRKMLDDLASMVRDRALPATVVALAVESPDALVREVASKLPAAMRVAIADAELARAFGDLIALPTVYVFDRDGHTVKVLYGASPTIHDDLSAAIAAAGKKRG